MADRVLHCECGFEARGAHEDALVAEVRRHAREAHNMALSHDEALLLAFRAEPDEAAALDEWGSGPADDPSRDESHDRQEEL